MSLAGWLIGGLVGATFGVAGFTFFYAKGASYLGHDAAACANCHVMQAQYDGWLQGSHRAVAACNDCHGIDSRPRAHHDQPPSSFCSAASPAMSASTRASRTTCPTW